MNGSGKGWQQLRWVLLLGLTVWAVQYFVQQRGRPKEVSYSQLRAYVAADKVEAIEASEHELRATLREPQSQNGDRRRVAAERLPGVDERSLIDELAAGVQVVARGVVVEDDDVAELRQPHADRRDPPL